eukprot:11467718-Alexandrium_andersonii.AAC.1
MSASLVGSEMCIRDSPKDMRERATFGEWFVGQADHTFKLEALGYVWGSVGVSLSRKLGGQRRKSFLPSVYVCYPAEKKRGNDLGLRMLKEEFARRGLPPLKQ